MKLYISADMEGTAAVASWTQVDPKNSTEYPYYRKLMSLEVRAAIDGARDSGATATLVNDSHSAMRNVLWDDLPDDVRPPDRPAVPPADSRSTPHATP